jgi:sarcosine oxidase subunit beta
MDGYADPHLALMGYKTAAEAAGATIRTNTPVEALTTDGTGAITGVRTVEEELAADVVVNATGAWAAELAATAGIQLPIKPKPRRAATVAPTHQPATDLPLVVDLDSGVYFRPFDDDQLLVGGHFETVMTDGASDPTVEPTPRPNCQAPLDWQATVLERAVDCAGYFGPDSTITGSWEGRYAMTPDENPIIEWTAPGLVTAAGFSGHGLMMAPATGQVVADLITTGRTEVADIQAYSSDRFEKKAGGAANDEPEQDQITF